MRVALVLKANSHRQVPYFNFPAGYPAGFFLVGREDGSGNRSSTEETAKLPQPQNLLSVVRATVNLAGRPEHNASNRDLRPLTLVVYIVATR